MPNQYPKCPHCNFEFDNHLDALERLTYPNIILIKGAKIFNKKYLISKDNKNDKLST